MIPVQRLLPHLFFYQLQEHYGLDVAWIGSYFCSNPYIGDVVCYSIQIFLQRTTHIISHIWPHLVSVGWCSSSLILCCFCLKEEILPDDVGRAIMVISLPSTREMMSFVVFFNMPVVPSISRLMSLSLIPEISTSLIMQSVKSTSSVHVHFVV